MRKSGILINADYDRFGRKQKKDETQKRQKLSSRYVPANGKKNKLNFKLIGYTTHRTSLAVSGRGLPPTFIHDTMKIKIVTNTKFTLRTNGTIRRIMPLL